MTKQQKYLERCKAKGWVRVSFILPTEVIEKLKPVKNQLLKEYKELNNRSKHE